MIKPLDWDTKFFGYKIGESQGIPDKSAARNEGYKLVYVRSKTSLPLETFCDHKITFSKKITPVEISSEKLKSVKGSPLTNELLELALLSGVHSRFNLDEKFKHDEFRKLYTEWIQKSLSGDLADEVFTYDDAGFVTVKLKNGEAHIGLIAVSPKAQGQGIGKKLLKAAEHFASQNNAHTLLVPTQLDNKSACEFYKSYGFHEHSIELTYHLWID